MSETIKEGRSRSKERKVKVDDKVEKESERSRSESPSKRKKMTIPKALREQVWIKHIGKKYESKCPIGWCTNTITVFDFQSGHIIPESKGGPTTLENLMPICSRCNLSMNNQYTITEWNTLGSNDQSFFKRVTSKLRLCIRLLLN
jgi:5-methylcytosine-specific restriction endonuclease McrA